MGYVSNSAKSGKDQLSPTTRVVHHATLGRWWSIDQPAISDSSLPINDRDEEPRASRLCSARLRSSRLREESESKSPSILEFVVMGTATGHRLGGTIQGME